MTKIRWAVAALVITGLASPMPTVQAMTHKHHKSSATRIEDDGIEHEGRDDHGRQYQADFGKSVQRRQCRAWHQPRRFHQQELLSALSLDDWTESPISRGFPLLRPLGRVRAPDRSNRKAVDKRFGCLALACNQRHIVGARRGAS